LVVQPIIAFDNRWRMHVYFALNLKQDRFFATDKELD